MQLRHWTWFSRVVESDEGHVACDRFSRGACGGKAVRHRDTNADAPGRGVGHLGGHRDPLADLDRVPQFHCIDGGSDNRAPAVARRRQNADDVHPLEDLAGAQKSQLVGDVGRDPLVQVRARA